MWNSALKKSSSQDKLELSLYIDDDDMATQGVLPKLGGDFRMAFGPRIVLSEMWNVAYKNATGDILMHCGDDIIFRTEGWDETVRSAFNEFNDRILFAFGDDGWHGSGFGTHGFVHRNWVDTLGYFVPPYFSSDFNDTWLNEVAAMIGRKKYIPIYTEHMHPMFGKGPNDQTHVERMERHNRDKVDEIYASKFPEREADSRKLMEFIKNYENIRSL